MVEFQLSVSRTNNDRINVKVQDKNSRVLVFSGDMSLEDWARASTGLAAMPVAVHAHITSECAKVIGRKKTTKSVTCPKVAGSDKEAQRAAVLHDYHTFHANRGWKLHADGTSSQQPGEHHRYTMYTHETNETQKEK
jgi:hypothetical protein